jgi:hypothetical protein
VNKSAKVVLAPPQTPVAPTTVNQTVVPVRRPNKDLRTR